MTNPLNERLRQYLTAEKSILQGGQSYRIGNRTMTRADLATIQREIIRLRSLGAKECDYEPAEPGYKKAKRIVFRD